MMKCVSWELGRIGTVLGELPYKVYKVYYKVVARVILVASGNEFLCNLDA